MELAVALPFLLMDPELSMILTPDEMNIINDIFLCDNEVCSKCLPSQSASENRKSITYANSETARNINKSRFDRAVCKILKAFEKHIDVLRMSPHYKCFSLSPALLFHHIRYFLEQYILCRMSLTPEQARSKELHYRNLWRCHRKSIEDIVMFTCDLEKQRADHQEMLENVVKHYKKNVITIDKIDNKCNEDVANITTRYERKQLDLYKAWRLEQKEIQLALENAMDDLESLKRMNRELEEDIRERRSVVESELLAIINTYDTEIGSKHRTLEELSKTYEYDKSEKHALQNEIERQEATYVAFVKRKEEAEMMLFHERLTAFQRERAAKFIQRWWRKVFRRKKKGKRRVKRKRT
ncbi:PREDICTED: IQ domain-containing protein D [Dinoponera quadriceps]|uniref:Dynein regulatory complex protein 10 n=1 Tax=Dinoponera quadriceps TaxID=609295 RepID=A0A6P3WMG6_DINQU|nr:PREDICTED: IQ domain-containing protein D [Dinoponera quadriceps]